jgi:hypothetical protein
MHLKFWPSRVRPLFSLSMGLQFCGWFLSYATMLYQLHLPNGHDVLPPVNNTKMIIRTIRAFYWDTQKHHECMRLDYPRSLEIWDGYFLQQ